MKDNVIQQKSYEFSLAIVKAYKSLVEEKQEYTLSKQLLKSWTSIWANIEEAIGGQSKKDFLSKMSIAYKEARETKYRIRLLKDTNYLSMSFAESLDIQVEEILRILWSIQKSLKTTSNS